MSPLLLGAAGLLALLLGGLVLRTFGPSYRVGRLLATTPQVSIADAIEIAESGRHRYVRIDGRIDAEEEFEDANHRPLVFRRTRLETRSDRGWQVFEDERQAVSFEVREGLDAIAIDHAALDAGLIVVPRESVGRAADLPDRVPPGIDPEATVRARIDQISSVEHAIVLGVPTVAGPPGAPTVAGSPGAPTARMSSGLGRPLVLSVLEPHEAMRVLAAGGSRRARLATLCLAAGVALIAASLAWAGLSLFVPALAANVPDLAGLIPSVLAASPEPSIPTGGDPRSDGQGPGLIGTPGLAILAVIAIGVVAVILTTVYVRLTDPRQRERRPR